MKSGISLSTAFIMAFASMTAEILLAQCATILYGGTVLRYSTIIGLFVFSLGMGSAFWAWSSREPSPNTFWRLEISLSWLGLLLPIFVFPMDHMMATFGVHSLFGIDVPIGYVTALSIAVVIGCLAGMELPVLLMVSKQTTKDKKQTLKWTRYMVGLDFVGTVAATFLVPVFFYPTLGIVGTAALAGGLNAILGWLISESKGSETFFLQCQTIILITASVVVFIWREEISLWLSTQAF